MMTELPPSIIALEIPLAKMLYLLNFSTESGEGGDKTRFWRGEMGFQEPEELRSHLLSVMSVDQLERTGQNSYGWRYNAVVELTGPSGVTWRVRTGWIAFFGESVARFVTAFPDCGGKSMARFQLFDAIKLTQPVLLDDNTLAPLGSPGAVVEVLGEGEAYLVEIFGPWVRRDEQGNTVPARPYEADAFQRTLDVVTLTDAEMEIIMPAGETVGAEAQLLSIVEELPREVVAEIVDFAQFLRHKQCEKAAVLAL